MVFATVVPNGMVLEESKYVQIFEKYTVNRCNHYRVFRSNEFVRTVNGIEFLSELC
jgi:hypothetical protein